MHPVHDVDCLLLLALLMAAKRRPAELLDVVAAADLINGNIPGEAKLVESFERLSRQGLLVESLGGYALTAAGEDLAVGLSRKASPAEQLFVIKDRLSMYAGSEAHPPVVLSLAQATAAIVAHRSAEKLSAKNLLVAKPKPEGGVSRPGQRQRKPMPARKRRV